MRLAVGLASLLALLLAVLCAELVYADSVTSAPPVSSVNGAQGDVTVQTVQRQVCAGLDISSGTATCTFPTAFKNPPTCWPTISPGSSSYVYSFPTPTADPTLTSVTFTAQAALKLLSISLGALTIWTNPPAGTKLTLSCVGALP